jgi:SpoVK/Ycf46/Vps4 family AAA+-type ATPase
LHDVDFDHLADATEGFSGADLQALLYNAHLEVVHESIGSGQISISTSATSSDSSSSSKDHRVDDTPPIEHTSFGGPAQNNDTVKSRAEQMAAHRRVRINPNLFFLVHLVEEKFMKLNLLGSACRNAVSVFFFCSCARSWLLHSVMVREREQLLRTSWSWSRIVQRYVFMFM